MDADERFEQGSEFQKLIDDQQGLVSQPQIASLGFSPSRVQKKVASGNWVRVLHGVYSVSTGPLTRRRKLLAALLACGPTSMLCHHTAAEEWGWIPIDEAEPVHVVVPYGRSAVGREPTFTVAALVGNRDVAAIGELFHSGVIVHRSRAFSFIGVQFELPRTSKVDTALDLAVSQLTAREAMRNLVANISNGRIPPAAVKVQMELRRPRRYLTALEEAVRMVESGVQSVLEERYLTLVEQAHGLPVAKRQSPVIVDGLTLYEDVDYSDTGVPLIVRLDGRQFHSRKKVAKRDRRRANAALLAGIASLVFSWEDVTEDPCQVARDILLILRRGGWMGTASLCAKCTPSGIQIAHKG